MFFAYAEMIDSENEITFTLHEKKEGHYDYENVGKWIPGQEKTVKITGIVVPISDKELRRGDGGSYTTEDMKVYTQHPAKNGEMITVDEVDYKLQRGRKYKGFADFHSFFAKKQVKK